MPVPNQFANVTTSIPLSQLDANFNTPITLGNTAIQLGNTVTTLNNMTLANVTVSSGNVTVTNVSITTANVTTANIATAQIANVTVSGTGTFAAGSNTAPSITFSGDTNTGIYSPGADQVAIATGGSQRVAVDSGGNFAVGISPLVVSTQRTIVFGNADTNGVQIRLQNSTTGTTSTDGALFSLAAGATSDAYLWNYENASTIFGTNNTERMRINAGAPILCLSGGNTSATGTGIAFPAIQSASSDANTLDDYEEGTFTPTFTSGFSVAPTNYSIQLGRYTKIGRFVYFQIDLDANGATANATQVRFGSLPFTAAAAPYGGAFVIYNSSFNTNTGDVYIVSDNTTEIHVNTNTGAARDGNSAGVNINNRIILTGCYQV